MSGAGRKSQYRKGITSQYLESEDFDLEEGDQVAQVLSNRGAHSFGVQLSSGEQEAAKLPNKFHKTIWLKPRDFVVVEGTESMSIKHILSKENIKQLKKAGKWPDSFQHDDVTAAGKKLQGGGVVVAVDPMGDYQYEEEEEEEGEEHEESTESTA